MTNHNPQYSEDVIDLLDIAKYLVKYARLIAMTTAAGLIIGIIFSVASFMQGEMSKQYIIKTSIAVTSQTEDGLFTSHSTNPNSTDIHLAEDMVDSVIFVIRSDRTLEKAVDQLQLIGITAKDIYDNLKITQYNKTQIIELSLYWRNAEEGIRILQAINDVSPRVLMDILKIGDVRVVNDPTSKYLIGGSIKASSLAMTTVLGLFSGMGIAVLMMLFKPTLINVSDAETRLGLPILGEIPNDRHYPGNNALITGETGPIAPQAHDSCISAAHVLAKTMDASDAKILYTTSANDLEGKTCVTAHLGLCLSEQEKKVLLIDMNFKAPKLGSMFVPRIEPEHSLNSVYHGDTSLEDAIVPINGFLHVLPLIQSEKDAIMSRAMLSLIKEQSAEYDYVLIDTSSVGGSADILNLNTIADGVLFVIKYDGAYLADIRDALQRLEKTRIPVLGCIVNRTTPLAR